MRAWLLSLPFLILFPTFFAYHWAAINELTPLFLGGFVNEMSAIICAGFLFALFRPRTKLLSLTSLDTLFLMFMIWFALVITINYILVTAPGVTKNHTAAFLQISATYLAARYIVLERIEKQLLWMAASLGVSVLWVAFTNPIDLLVAGSDESSVANYQSLSRTFCLTAVFGLYSVRTQFVRWTGYLLTTFILFLLGARSEVAGLFIFVAVFEIFSSTHPIRKLSLFVISTVVVAIALFSSLDVLVDLFPDNRALYLLQLGFDDESVIARSVAQQNAWNAILDSPLLGDYGHYEREVSAGFYAHNWLGAWVDLGLLGMFLFFSLHMYAAWCALRAYGLAIRTNEERQKRRIALAIGLLAMILIFNLFAKNFADTGLAVAIGFLASLVACRQTNRNQARSIPIRKNHRQPALA